MGKISATIETPSSSSTTDDVIWKFTERKIFWHKVRMRKFFQCKITARIFFQNTKSQREKSSNTKSQALRFLSHHSQLQGLSLLLLSLGKKLCYLGFFFVYFFNICWWFIFLFDKIPSLQLIQRRNKIWTWWIRTQNRDGDSGQRILIFIWRKEQGNRVTGKRKNNVSVLT